MAIAWDIIRISATTMSFYYITPDSPPYGNTDGRPSDLLLHIRDFGRLSHYRGVFSCPSQFLVSPRGRMTGDLESKAGVGPETLMEPGAVTGKEPKAHINPMGVRLDCM